MQLPIPDDWNGDDWMCVQIEWPDSPLWLAILQGFISAATRGRLWDADSGSILGVQAIGREIWARNIPLTDCQGTQAPTDPETVETVTGIGDILTMTGCYIPRGAVRVVNGVLQFKDICGDWYDVVTIEELTAEGKDDDNPIVDPQDPQTYSLCGKANGYLRAVEAVAFASWEAVSLAPQSQEGHVRSAVDWATLGRSSLWLTIAAASTVQALSSEGTVFDGDRWDRAICKAVKGMQNTTNMSEDEREFALGSLRSVVFDEYPPIVDEAVWNFFKNASDTLGKQDGRYAGTVGAADLDATCDCPQQTIVVGPENASIDGWYLGEAVAVDISDFTEDYQCVRAAFTCPEDLFGLAVQLDFVGEGTVKPMGYDNTCGSSPYDPTAIGQWGDTSAHWENDPDGTIQLMVETEEIAGQLAAKNAMEAWRHSSGGTWSSDGTTPLANHVASLGNTYGTQFERDTEEDPGSHYLTIVRIWPVYNIASPSHA